ncbi:nuclear transport factor 2 family protein [Chryseobacterium gregarium]|uniref:nuclear transport factor 2 family protein n=1 Tax=Chryseobacterium gregarium TaxID=456299 RepID=UPI0004075604|nr:nuclear transport factor 2 family protein [Chryseobacterium gregarium]
MNNNDFIIDDDQSDLKSTAIKLENARGVLMVNANIPHLQEILSPDLYYGHSGGYFDTNESFLEKLNDATYDYHKLSTVIDKVVPIGEAGFSVHGEVQIIVTIDGKYLDLYSIYMAVYRKEEGVWKFLAHQTALKKEN